MLEKAVRDAFLIQDLRYRGGGIDSVILVRVQNNGALQLL